MKKILQGIKKVVRSNSLQNSRSVEHELLPTVFQSALYLADRCDAKWIIEIGCGEGENLKLIGGAYKIAGVDDESLVAQVRKKIPKAKLIAFDLETGLPDIECQILKQAVVICNNVIDRLVNPENMLEKLAAIAENSPFVLIATENKSLNNELVKDKSVDDWGLDEKNAADKWIGQFENYGFKGLELLGRITPDKIQDGNTSLLAITGTHANYRKTPNACKVAAIIHSYNEVDIIAEVVEHLVEQNVEVHMFDNWSDDGTWEKIMELKKIGKIENAERFPESPSSHYQWFNQLEKTSSYAVELNVDWIIHHDADEIRESPWSGVSLRDAISRIDQLGYNAIDFTVIDFRFLETCTNVEPPYQQTLRYFEFGRRPGHFLQIKAWKNQTKVDLASRGGHEAIFNNRRVFPLKFLLKHYPLRNAAQARKKIFDDRLPRFSKEKEARGWHHQYDKFKGRSEINGWSIDQLSEWRPNQFYFDYLIERLTGIGLLDKK